MSDSRRLLVISYYFGPDGSVGGLRWAGITKYLARLGWQASVITATPAVRKGASSGAHVEWCPRLPTFLDGCRLLRRLALGRGPALAPKHESIGTPGAELRGLAGLLRREVAALIAFPDESRGWLVRAALRARAVIRRFEPQVVISSGPPHSAHLVAALATIGRAVRWFIDLRDPWGGPLTQAWASHARVGTRVFRTLSTPLERLTFGAADGVITNTHQLAAVLTERYPDVRVLCVPNGVDPENLPAPPRHPYPGLGIAYAGTLYAGRDLGPVVRALRLFLERHPEAARAGSKLRIAGTAELRHARALSDAVAAAGMEQYVELLGPLPRVQALELVCRSRLAVVLAQEQELQVPAKLYESVAMGVATLVVAAADSAAGVEGNRIGAIVRDADDVEGIAGGLEQLWCDGSGGRSPSPVPITYEAIAPLVDDLLRKTGAQDDAAYQYAR